MAKKVMLVRDGRSVSARVGVGAGFVRPDGGAVPGDWSPMEMDRNARTGALGVPARRWNEGSAGYEYYMLVG